MSTCQCSSCRGERDKLADEQLVENLMKQLGRRATLQLFKYADHSFHVPVKSGQTDAEVRTELLDALANWIDGRILRRVQP